MSLRAFSDFETGDLSDFDSSTAGAEFFVTNTNPISGTYSLAIGADATPGEQGASFNMDLMASLGDIYRYACLFNINDLDLGTHTSLDFIGFFGSPSGIPAGALIVSGADILFAIGGASPGQCTTPIGDGADHSIEVRVVKESGPGNGDGEVQIYIDGAEEYSDTAVSNYFSFDDSQNAGGWIIAVIAGDSGAGSGQSGTCRVDDFTFRDDDTPIFPDGPPTPSGDGLVAAAMTKPCSIDADGGYIYIAALNEANRPIIIRFSTALNADGSTVFNPGAGADIGVECSATDANVVWTGGDFSATDTVALSTDGGGSFIIVDPATFDPVTSFRVGPDDDSRCLVATETPGGSAAANLYETFNDGADWLTRASGLSSPTHINAIDRLPINPEEIVIGNNFDVVNRIDYSPNSGQNLEDLTAGSYAGHSAGVIVG